MKPAFNTGPFSLYTEKFIAKPMKAFEPYGVAEPTLAVTRSNFGVAKLGCGLAEANVGVAVAEVGVATPNFGVAKSTFGLAKPDFGGVPPKHKSAKFNVKMHFHHLPEARCRVGVISLIIVEAGSWRSAIH